MQASACTLTESIRDSGGARLRKAAMKASQSLPSTSSNTPSASFNTQPPSPCWCASCHTNGRKPTPCTGRSEEHTSELQSLMRNSYNVFCLKKKQQQSKQNI